MNQIKNKNDNSTDIFCFYVNLFKDEDFDNCIKVDYEFLLIRDIFNMKFKEIQNKLDLFSLDLIIDEELNYIKGFINIYNNKSKFDNYQDINNILNSFYEERIVNNIVIKESYLYYIDSFKNKVGFIKKDKLNDKYQIASKSLPNKITDKIEEFINNTQKFTDNEGYNLIKFKKQENKTVKQTIDLVNNKKAINNNNLDDNDSQNNDIENNDETNKLVKKQLNKQLLTEFNTTNYLDKLEVALAYRELNDLPSMKIKYESQNIKEIISDIKNHPNQLRALFFKESYLTDNTLYLYTKKEPAKKTTDSLENNLKTNVYAIDYHNKDLIKLLPKNSKKITKTELNKIFKSSKFIDYLELNNLTTNQKQLISFELSNILLKLNKEIKSDNIYNTIYNLINQEGDYIKEFLSEKEITNLTNKLSLLFIVKNDINTLENNIKKINFYSEVKNEEELIKQLEKMNAQIKPIKLKYIPKYDSKHDITKGFSYQLNTKNYKLTYTPKTIKKKIKYNQKVNKISLSPRSKDQIVKKLKNKKYIQNLFVLMTFEYIYAIKTSDLKNSIKLLKYLENKENLNNEYIIIQLSDLVKNSIISSQDFYKISTSTNKIEDKKIDNINIHEVDINNKAMKEQAENFMINNCNYLSEDGYFFHNKAELKQYQKSKIYEKFLTDNIDLLSEALTNTANKFNLDKKDKDYDKTIDVYDFSSDIKTLFKQEFFKAFKNEIDNKELDILYKYIASKGIKFLLEINEDLVVKESNEIPKQEAIKSEIGVLKVEDITNLNQVFKDLDLNTIEEKVPYNVLYPNNNRKGLVNFYADEYLLGKELRIPQKAAVLHGITGVENSDALVRRLERIKNTGALKSITERRRSGILVNSLSPIGDMASGIDMGVPCTLGLIPNFGQEAYFVLKPSNLMKRNMFFSNEDFGGGYDRFDNFSEYGEEIEHPNIYLPPTHKSRLKHFQNICLTDEDDENEVYIKGEIPLEDIAAIIVREEYYKKVKSLVSKWEQEGIIIKVYKTFKGEYNQIDVPTTNGLVKEITQTFSNDLIEILKDN